MCLSLSLVLTLLFVSLSLSLPFLFVALSLSLASSSCSSRAQFAADSLRSNAVRRRALARIVSAPFSSPPSSFPR